jgi:hypothetical protein
MPAAREIANKSQPIIAHMDAKKWLAPRERAKMYR